MKDEKLSEIISYANAVAWLGFFHYGEPEYIYKQIIRKCLILCDKYETKTIR